MRKLIVLSFVSLITFVPELYSISLAEHMQQHGMPELEDTYCCKELNLSHKGLTSLEGLQDLPVEMLGQVSKLNLSYNSLQTLPADIFSDLHNLEHLDLYTNRLQTLPIGIFNGLSNLQVLKLDNNELKELPISIFSNLHNLVSLYIAFNQLKELPTGIFSGLNLELLMLLGNPFRGDFLLSLPDIIHSIPTLKCLDFNPLIDRALNSYCVYNPKTLKESVLEYLMQNLTSEQIEELAHTSDLAFNLLPLSEDKKKQYEIT